MTIPRGVVTFISNRKWLGGRSYPAMRQSFVEDFDVVVVDDLHGSTNDIASAGEGSVFTTTVASGIKIGTAIVTAVRRGEREVAPLAVVRRRDLHGSGAAKRATLAEFADDEIDAHLRRVPVSERSRYRFVDDAGDDFPSVDEYLDFYRSGVQPVRDEAVIAIKRDTLIERMREYFDASVTFEQLTERHPGFAVSRSGYNPEQVRQRLLVSSTFHPERIVPFLYRPFDVRWMYWEPDHKLLHRPRPELLPYWLAIPEQRCLVLPQTARRPGAVRPVVSTAVASFASAEPDARLFPLFRPGSELHGVRGGLETEIPPPIVCVADEWIVAARAAGLSGTDEELGTVLFYALVAAMNAPAWISTQPSDLDDFPTIPLPGGHDELSRAAALGRRIADLDDPTVDVPGVTSGSIDIGWADVGVPDRAIGEIAIAFGTYGSSGGRRLNDAVLWDVEHGWRNVPDDVWSFTSAGHQVLPKWLSYRVREPLNQNDREQFMLLCRRIAAIRALESDCDAVYRESLSNPLVILAPGGNG